LIYRHEKWSTSDVTNFRNESLDRYTFYVYYVHMFKSIKEGWKALPWQSKASLFMVGVMLALVGIGEATHPGLIQEVGDSL